MIPIPKVKIQPHQTNTDVSFEHSALCKVFERVILREILNHTKQYKGYEFLHGRNTMDALFQVIGYLGLLDPTVKNR